MIEGIVQNSKSPQFGLGYGEIPIHTQVITVVKGTTGFPHNSRGKQGTSMTPQHVAHDPHRRRAGYVLIVMALSAFVLFGMLGLGLDLGHVFIAKNEAQTYTDAA